MKPTIIYDTVSRQTYKTNVLRLYDTNESIIPLTVAYSALLKRRYGDVIKTGVGNLGYC